MMNEPVTATTDARFRGGLAAATQATVRGALKLAELLFEWRERACQRRALGGLSDYMLRDIGVSRAEAKREAGKPFWRP